MILSSSEISDIIKNNPGKKRIAEAREYLKKMRMHIYGENLDSYITNIEGYEKLETHKVRSKYASSNKDLFARLKRPIDKVFTAKGGATYYNLPEQQQKKAIALSQSFLGGISLKKWLEVYWLPHMLDDPFGLLLMELLPVQQAVLAKQQGRSYVYPTYKPVSGVFDYKTTGTKVEWAVFELTKEEKRAEGVDESKNTYRVIDDSFDYLVIYERDTVTILPGKTFPNYFGFVPAMVNSDLINPAKEEYFLSFFDEAIDLADKFLLKGSIKAVHEFLHGFPKYAEFADTCPDCGGSTFKEGDPCKACRGTGKKLITKVEDAKLLSWPTKEDPVIMPNQVAGYVSPDKAYYEIATSDLTTLENLMFATLWGTNSKMKTSGLSVTAEGPKTATEIVDDMKPQADRLSVISEMAERRHKFILDCVILLQVSVSYSGSTVHYGRRFLLESADVLFDKYSNARAKGAPQVILDAMLNEYYEAAYSSDPVSLETAKKLMYVEPFVHYSPQQVDQMNVEETDRLAKVYFSEWIATVEEGTLISDSVDGLKELLYEFVNGKRAVQPDNEGSGQSNRTAAA